MTFVERLSFEVSDGGRQHYRFAGSYLRVQMKAIAAVVGGLLEEVLKDRIGAP